MFDNALGGPVVTIGLVVIVFTVCGVILGAASWINHRMGAIERHCLDAVAAVSSDLVAFKLTIARDYLSRDGAKELLEPVLSEMRLRFDSLAEQIAAKRRPAAPARTIASRRKQQRQQT